MIEWKIFYFEIEWSFENQYSILFYGHSTSKYQSVKVKVEIIENIENLASVNLEKKIAKNLSNSAFFEEVAIQKSMKFFISHTFNLFREFRFFFIEFVDNSSFFFALAWFETSLRAFDNSIKNIFDFEKNLITVVERAIILTNSFDNDPLDRNRIVKLIITSSSNDISHQNLTVENENENIENNNMSFVKNLSEISADNEINKKN